MIHVIRALGSTTTARRKSGRHSRASRYLLFQARTTVVQRGPVRDAIARVFGSPKIGFMPTLPVVHPDDTWGISFWA